MNYRFLIIGGDLRQQYLYESLISNGYTADLIFYKQHENLSDSLSKINIADVIILPVPSSQDKIHLFTPMLSTKIKLEDITKQISKNAILFTGGENPLFTSCKTKKTVNLLSDENMTLKNAMATAEAALSILINESVETIHGSKILLLGYGRISRILSSYLKAMQAKVTICARKSTARTIACIDGLSVIGFDDLLNSLENFNVIINTVPAMVLTEKELYEIKKDTILIDLASKPGGIDFKSAEALNLKAIQALSLPGKYSPKAAAKYIEECIFNTIV